MKTETDFVKNDIVYVVQTNEAIKLSDASLGYIYHRIEQREKELQRQIDYWKGAYYGARIPPYELYWNELRLWLRREGSKHPEFKLYYDEVAAVMGRLEAGESVR